MDHRGVDWFSFDGALLGYHVGHAAQANSSSSSFCFSKSLQANYGLQFCSIKRCALPALSDGFFREYKEWMESFAKRLEQYDSKKLESAV